MPASSRLRKAYAPVEDPSVMQGIHAAVTRRRPDRSPGPDGWYPAERLTVEQAVHAYTMGAARAAGQEANSGSISAGKLTHRHTLKQTRKEGIRRIPSLRIVVRLAALSTDGSCRYCTRSAPHGLP